MGDFHTMFGFLPPCDDGNVPSTAVLTVRYTSATGGEYTRTWCVPEHTHGTSLSFPVGHVQSRHGLPNLPNEVIGALLPAPRSHCDIADQPDLPIPPGAPGTPTPGPTPGPTPDDPPRVTVTGTVTAPVNLPGPPHLTAEEQRPLSWATYDLRFKTRDGQWQAVRKNPGNTGDPVTGHLNAAGEFRLEFVYPQDYLLENETLWRGCAPTNPPVAYLRSHACAAEDVQLRVFARNSDDSVHVKVDDELTVAAIIELGRFYEPRTPTTHEITTPAALAYRAAYNVKDLATGHDSGNLDLHMNLVRQGEKNQYNPATRTIDLDPNLAGTGVPEYEASHALMHGWYGDDYINMIDITCSPGPDFLEFSSNTCAMANGFAHWFALASENGYGHTDHSFLNLGDAWFDLERCAAGSGTVTTVHCRDEGQNVEARVAAALWDLHDIGEAPSPTSGGFAEGSTHSMSRALNVLRQHEPDTFGKFWNAWRQGLSDESERRDRESVYLNTLVYTGLFDGFTAQQPVGKWDIALCNTCVRGEFISSRFGVESQLMWNVSSAVPETGLYDIWVRVPAGTMHNDSQATYEITTSFGVETVTLDHTAANDDWINLGKHGFELLHGTDLQLRLLNGPATPGDSTAETLVADAAIIAPHQD